MMVLDAAKCIEEQTRMRFEACRLRDVPIITFVNELDREAAALSTFSMRSAKQCDPAHIRGEDFLGTYDLTESHALRSVRV